MNDKELQQLVELYSVGQISDEQHRALEAALVASPETRQRFRELVDLETGLSEWAVGTGSDADLDQKTGSVQTSDRGIDSSRRGQGWVWNLVIAASLLIAVSLAWGWWPTGQEKQRLVRSQTAGAVNDQEYGAILQTNCVWSDEKGNRVDLLNEDDSIRPSTYRLVSGVAQFKFDSGSRLTLEGPSEVVVDSIASAKLIHGSVVVSVSEVSDGFLLETPDASIVDLGTEYGVTIDDDSTEVHVFDGRVVWQPIGADEQEFTTIDDGQANRFARSQPRSAIRIPFGKRQFVRELAAQVQRDASGELLAYDGFENLAGKLRRGRSGFGWDGGWKPPGRRRSNASIMDAPAKTFFGHDGTGLRLMDVGAGTTIQRKLLEPVTSEQSIYLSFILHRDGPLVERSSFQLTVSGVSAGRPRRRQSGNLSVGITSRGFPFVKNDGVVNEVASRLSDEVVFCAAKLSRAEGKSKIQLRIFAEGERISAEPVTWTVSSDLRGLASNLDLIQLTSGQAGKWRIDELRIGKTWESILIGH